jgi:hypothetical protein
MDDFDWVMSTGEKTVCVALLHIRLSKAINRNLELLQRLQRRGSLAHVAWLARNLLELRIWVDYCSLSIDNAQDFYFDAIRDLVDLNKKTTTGLDAETNRRLEKAKTILGTDRPAHKFKDVRDAAKEAGLQTFYSDNCKVLSKFVHPTALSIVAPVGEAAEAEIRKQFVEAGRGYAGEAVKTLDSSCVGDVYRKYRKSIERVNLEQPKDKRLF